MLKRDFKRKKLILFSVHMETSLTQRENGNLFFKHENYQEAIKCFNAALAAAKDDDQKASALKNLAISHLKINEENKQLYHAQEAFINYVSALDFGYSAKKNAIWVSKISDDIEIARKRLFNTINHVHKVLSERVKVLYYYINRILNYDHREGIRSHFYHQVALLMYKKAFDLQEQEKHQEAISLLRTSQQEIEFADASSQKSKKIPGFPKGVDQKYIENIKISCEAYSKSFQMLFLGNKEFESFERSRKKKMKCLLM